MASTTIGKMRDYLRSLSYWVTGRSISNPKVVIANNYATIKSAPVTGAKTAGTTASEIFAATTRLAHRHTMCVFNDSSNIVYIGNSGVTTSNGYPLPAGNSITFNLDPSIDTSIYFIASTSSTVRVMELA